MVFRAVTHGRLSELANRSARGNTVLACGRPSAPDCSPKPLAGARASGSWSRRGWRRAVSHGVFFCPRKCVGSVGSSRIAGVSGILVMCGRGQASPANAGDRNSWAAWLGGLPETQLASTGQSCRLFSARKCVTSVTSSIVTGVSHQITDVRYSATATPPCLVSTERLRTCGEAGGGASELCVGLVSLQLVKSFTMGRTKANVKPTNGRFTNYGRGHLVPAVRSIGRNFS